jgi:hypothetical protein
MANNEKCKRGAPKKEGLLKGVVLIRRLLAVEAYQKARMGGKTDRIAKEFAEAEIKRIFPKMKISKTEIERALAEFQPNTKMKENQEVFVCETGDTPFQRHLVNLKVIKYKSLRKPNPINFGKNKIK